MLPRMSLEVWIWVLMPITSPCEFAVPGHRNCPGLIAASVWTMLGIEQQPRRRWAARGPPTDHPTVRLRSRPKGLPIATARLAHAQRARIPEGGRVQFLGRRLDADHRQSLRGSGPAPRAVSFVPSARVTSTRTGSPTTWLLVRILPSVSRMIPDPCPARTRAGCPPPPLGPDGDVYHARADPLVQVR